MKIIAFAPALLALAIAGCAEPASDAGSPAASAPATSAPAPAAELAPLDAPVDFRGTWVLNTDRGENLGMMKAVKETIIATQTAEQVTFDMTDVFAGVTTTRTVVYDLNGAVMQNEAAMGAASETVTSWDGDKLVTTWTADGAIGGTTTERTEIRWLTDDGRTLNVSMGRADNPPILFVYEKAE